MSDEYKVQKPVRKRVRMTNESNNEESTYDFMAGRTKLSVTETEDFLNIKSNELNKLCINNQLQRFKDRKTGKYYFLAGQVLFIGRCMKEDPNCKSLLFG